MAVSRDTIRRWLNRGVADKDYTHMLVVVDQFGVFNYPVYVLRGEDPRQVQLDYDTRSMQHVMEVYNLSMDIETQLAQHRAFNY